MTQTINSGIALPSDAERLEFIDKGVRALTYLKVFFHLFRARGSMIDQLQLEPTNKNKAHNTAPVDLSYFTAITILEVQISCYAPFNLF